MNKKFDYIIIGQGLAGSALSLLLKSRGARVLVLASPSKPAASKVAGGIINPIVLKRYTATWENDSFFNHANSFYKDFEDTCGQSFLYPRDLLKILGSDQEASHFLQRRNAEKLIAEFTAPTILPNENPNINAPFGFVKLKNISVLDTACYLSEVTAYLSKTNSFSAHVFDPKKLNHFEDHVEYDSYVAKKIILCGGWYQGELPWFDFLRFKFVKGEILKLRIPGLLSREILKHKVYLIPQRDDTYLAGATYDWNELDNRPSEKGKEQLLEDVKNMLNLPVEVIGHFAGVRPATYDRRPFAGAHREFSNIYIFNGLGTRGAMQSPLLASYVADELLEEKIVPAEMHFERCL